MYIPYYWSVFDRWTFHRYVAMCSLERVDHWPLYMPPSLHRLLFYSIRFYRNLLVNEILVIAVYERNFGAVKSLWQDHKRRRWQHQGVDVLRMYFGSRFRQSHYFYLMSWQKGDFSILDWYRKSTYNERRGANNTKAILCTTVNVYSTSHLLHTFPYFRPKPNWMYLNYNYNYNWDNVSPPTYAKVEGNAANGFASPCYLQRMYENLCHPPVPSHYDRIIRYVIYDVPGAFLFLEHVRLHHS